MGQYTIKQLSEMTGYSIASLYSYMRTDEETKRFFYEEHREQRTKGGNLYDDAALERLKNHFGARNDVAQGILENEEPPIPDDTAPGIDDKDIIITAIKADLERERAEKAILLEQISELQRQNGNLLLLLNQEKQEKQALLPQPRQHKTIGERIKGLFQKGERE